MPSRSAPPRLHVEIRIPEAWEESLLWLLDSEGWGTGIAESTFKVGFLEGEDSPAASRRKILLVLDPVREEALRDRLAELALAWSWEEGSWSMSAELRQEEDGEALWRSRWKSFRCGRLVVHPDFVDPGGLPLRSSDLPLRIVAGSAFGTGGHCCTRMGLRALQEWVQGAPLGRVLDIGCGSGILAVAALLLGAERAAGMDPEAAAPAQARATARANGVEDRSHFWLGRHDSVGGVWDTVLANLQGDLLIQAAPAMGALLAPGGRLYAGGILLRGFADCSRAFSSQGLSCRMGSRRGRWVSLIAQRSGS